MFRVSGDDWLFRDRNLDSVGRDQHRFQQSPLPRLQLNRQRHVHAKRRHAFGRRPGGPAGSEIIGNLGTGTFTQSGGTNTFIGNGAHFYLGYGSTGNGTYYLSTGTFSNSGNNYVGYSGTGTFDQSGGTNYPGLLNLGCQSTGVGTYYLRAGTIQASGENISGYGTGTFTQSGGTNIVGSSLNLVDYSTGSGTYNLKRRDPGYRI